MLNFAIERINTVAIDLDIRIFTKRLVLRSIYLQIFNLIQALLSQHIILSKRILCIKKW
jgi:hypothetical protein